MRNITTDPVQQTTIEMMNIFSIISGNCPEASHILKTAGNALKEYMSAEEVFFYLRQTILSGLLPGDNGGPPLNKFPRLYDAITTVLEHGTVSRIPAWSVFNDNNLTNRELLLFPMLSEAGITGVCMIALASAKKAAKKEHLSVIPHLLDWLQLMLDHANLKKISMLDGLTDLWNRRYFDSVYPEAFSTARRHNRIFSLVLLDLDHFKHVNDNYGHQSGDLILRKTGSIIRDVIRKGSDIACRIGGEEFALLLPDTDSHQATTLAERLRRNVSQATIVTKKAKLSISASFGIAAFREHAVEQYSLFSIADKALYKAKETGRNRVVVAAVDSGKSSTPKQENDRLPFMQLTASCLPNCT